MVEAVAVIVLEEGLGHLVAGLVGIGRIRHEPATHHVVGRQDRGGVGIADQAVAEGGCRVETAGIPVLQVGEGLQGRHRLLGDHRGVQARRGIDPGDDVAAESGRVVLRGIAVAPARHRAPPEVEGRVDGVHATEVTDAVLHGTRPADLVQPVVDKHLGGLIAQLGIAGEGARLQAAAGDDAVIRGGEAGGIDHGAAQAVVVERGPVVGHAHAEGEGAERTGRVHHAVIGIAQGDVGVVRTVEGLEEPHGRVGPDVVAEAEADRGGASPVERGAEDDVHADRVAAGIHLAHGEAHGRAGGLRRGIIAPGEPEARAAVVAGAVARLDVEGSDGARRVAALGGVVEPRETAHQGRARASDGAIVPDGVDPGLARPQVHGAAGRDRAELQGVPAVDAEPIADGNDHGVDRGARQGQAETDRQLVALDVQGEVGHLEADVVGIPEGDDRLQDDVPLVETRAVRRGGGGEDELHARDHGVAVDRLVVVVHRVALTGGTAVARGPHLDDGVRRARDHRLAILQHVIDHRVPAADRRDEAETAVGAVVGSRVIDVALADRTVVGPPIQQGVAVLVAAGGSLAVEERPPVKQVGPVGVGGDLRAVAEQRQPHLAVRVGIVDVIPGLGQERQVAAEAAVGRVDQEARRIGRVVVEARLVGDAHGDEPGLDGGVEAGARRQGQGGRRLRQSQRREVDGPEGAGPTGGLEDIGDARAADRRRRRVEAHERLLVLARHPPGERAVGGLVGQAGREILRGERHAIGQIHRGGVDADERGGIREGGREQRREVTGVGPERQLAGGGGDRWLLRPRADGAGRVRIDGLDRSRPRQARGGVEDTLEGAADGPGRDETSIRRQRRRRGRRRHRGDQRLVGVGGQPAEETTTITDGDGAGRLIIIIGGLEVVVRALQRAAEVIDVGNLVVETFPAAPDAEDREVEGVGRGRVVVGRGGGGDAGVRPEHLLHAPLGEAERGDGVEAGARQQDAVDREPRLDLEEGGQHDDHDHQSGGHDEGQDQGKTLSLGRGG